MKILLPRLTSLVSYHSINLFSFSQNSIENITYTCCLQPFSSYPLLNQSGVAPSLPNTVPGKVTNDL